MWPTSTPRSELRRLGVATLAALTSFAFLVATGPTSAFAQPADASFSVRMLEQEVHGYHWEEGIEVMLEIDDPANGAGVDYSDTQLALPPAWDPTMGFVQFQPFIDDFLPVHNLESLELLANHLSDLADTRPVRKQVPLSFEQDRIRQAAS